MIKDFTVLRKENLPYYSGQGTLLQHDKTGMKIFYFRPNKSNENYFSYIFKTPVEDDTGIAHALEHMVLQGSKKYPIKNLFFHLTQKALTKELNAATAQYYTKYHAKTYISEDYYRLLEAYGDAVFFPILDRNAFNQEVWRFDLDENSQPFINGVVFNEMSAINKIKDYTIRKYEQKTLYSGSDYAFNSGGDFLEIPELTRDKLYEFHKRNYTPANCLLFLYGKIDLEEQLAFLEETLLNHLPEGTKEVYIKDEIIPLHSMSEIKVDIPFEGIEDVSVELDILCKDGMRKENEERDLFIDRIANILEKELKFAGVGKIYTKKRGSPKHKYFVVGFNSVNKCNIESAKTLILESLVHCLDNGMDYEELQSACSKNDLKFENTISFPKIDTLERMIVSGYVESNDVFANIFEPEKNWAELKTRILSYRDEDFKSMLHKYLVDNANKVFVIKTPDKNYFEKIQEERKNLIEKKLSESKRKSVSDIKADKVLFEKYQKEDDSELLDRLFPPLNIKELKNYDDSGLASIEEIDGKYGPVTLFSSVQETDGKTYVKISFALDDLSEEEFKQITWVASYLQYFGFDGKNLSEIKTIVNKLGLCIEDKLIAKYSGSDMGGSKIYENRYWMDFSFYCYSKNIEECMKLIHQSIYSKNFDDIQELTFAKEKLSEQFKKIDFAKVEKYAVRKVSSYFSKHEFFDNESMGLNQIKTQIENSQKNIDSIVQDYRNIYTKIVNGSAVINIFCEEKFMEKSKQTITEFIQNSEIKPLKNNALAYLNEKNPIDKKDVSTIITQVSSGSLILMFNGDEYPTKSYAASQVLLTWFNENMLIKELRKLHGTYGCSCMLSAHNNRVIIRTTRDPDPTNSLETIENCLKQLSLLDNDIRITEDYIKELALKEYSSAVGDIDPINKGQISYSRRLLGHTPEERRMRLKHILEINRHDFIEAGKRIAEQSKNLKACILTGDKNKTCGNVICNMNEILNF